MAAPSGNTPLRSLQKFKDAFVNNKFLRLGLPMLILIVGGSFALKEFAVLRYETQYIRRKIDPEVEERLKKGKKDAKITLEGEYEKMQEQDLDNWTNIRGPRPWEDSKEIQDAQRLHMQDTETKSKSWFGLW
ncbi:cytochrome c oxidase assembly protein COX16 homolog, mitochondrial-like [Ptychodera flava]|uniref:cytochrome c oxidase assembly protein COX16 homolog, mitochondrial-like n=1 Tax=Ptychodera flava TaxID=63121 RepID=UPI00396A17C3